VTGNSQLNYSSLSSKVSDVKIGATRWDSACDCNQAASTGKIDDTSISNFRGVANVSLNTGVASVNINNQINSSISGGTINANGPGPGAP
jgi:hypothetical protein